MDILQTTFLNFDQLNERLDNSKLGSTQHMFFFFYWTDGHGGPYTVWHTRKISIYSRDETTDKYHFPGIAGELKRIETKLICTVLWGWCAVKHVLGVLE